jgi:hypothetical protein
VSGKGEDIPMINRLNTTPQEVWGKEEIAPLFLNFGIVESQW